jgi:hypothetical protein
VAAGRGRLGAWAIGMSGLRGNWITAMGSYTTQVSALPSVRFDTTWHGAEMEPRSPRIVTAPDHLRTESVRGSCRPERLPATGFGRWLRS